jgi:lipid-A-disaccharide synthase
MSCSYTAGKIMPDKTIFFSAGDTSGDTHAANLIRELKRLDPELSFVGFGLEQMRESGMVDLEESESHAPVIWLHNLLHLGSFRRKLKTCREWFEKGKVDAVVLVDFGGFNLFVAKAAAQRDIPVFYYILPQIWAHGRYRIKKVRKWVSRAFVIYPFEPDIYREYGVETEYVGHPFFDELKRRPVDETVVENIRKKSGGKIVALFPGSRSQEVKKHLRLLIPACRKLRKKFPDIRFATICPPHARNAMEDAMRGCNLDIQFPNCRPVELAKASYLCLTKSGTISLEIASQNTPMIIFYAINPLLYFFAKGMAYTPYIGIVNVLADEMVCPEKVMWHTDPSWIVTESSKLLMSPQHYEQQRERIREVMAKLAQPGASQKTARLIIREIDGYRVN